MTKMEIPNYVQMCHKLRAEKRELQKRIDRMEEQRRERFAMAAMQGLCGNPCSFLSFDPAIPEYAVQYADALISELDKEQE